METFDLTPDPRVLIALTHTPMQPLDALCELIDNAIDSFQVAKLQGNPIKDPLIIIDLPRPSELGRHTGLVRVRDNGSGLSRGMAERAIKAGFSGNNPYDSLGLFGMGFNISTGKLGRVTKFQTARTEKDKAIEVIIDLEQITNSGSYAVPFEWIEKPAGISHGTIVEVDSWWPEGNPNSGFVRKLVQYGMPTVRAEIGRRYATILRERNVRIIINQEPCQPYEHCYWSDSRTVERRGTGVVPAVFRFDKLIGAQKRCSACTALLSPADTSCPACGSSNQRTIEERIRGWVGIQRFDHESDFGIDLIRNGRAIRIGEKGAFFEYIDEFKRVIKDYPIDSPYGRIIGEVHLDHVPVDFLKQDFQRSSPEWQRAISYLRGETPLQPGKLKPGETNESPVFKLYQGFRRVRTPGKTDMYMGYWDAQDDKPKRISRDIEKELFQKFKAREPGYYDDSEWWKLVEQADLRPVEELVDCPECGSQNLKDQDVCSVCGVVLIGKPCANEQCQQTIPQSAASCPHCGYSQIAEVKESWTCQVCRRTNSPDADICIDCGSARGTANPLSKEFLLEHSNKSDDLSIPGCSVLLADGTYSSPIDVDTYVTQAPILSPRRSLSIPIIVFKEERIHAFVDKAHPLFRSYRIQPEQVIASEVALYIHTLNSRLTSKEYFGHHELSGIAWSIVQERWSTQLEDTPERVRTDITAFFSSLRERLPELIGEGVSDFFDDLDDEEKKGVIEKMLRQGIDISELGKMKTSGKYTRYLEASSLVNIFRRAPEFFFDRRFWEDTYSRMDDIPQNIMENAQVRIRTIYLDCLADIARFLEYLDPDPIIVQRARASLGFLQQRIV
jgi:hypothetical protein